MTTMYYKLPEWWQGLPPKRDPEELLDDELPSSWMNTAYQATCAEAILKMAAWQRRSERLVREYGTIWHRRLARGVEVPFYCVNFVDELWEDNRGVVRAVPNLPFAVRVSPMQGKPRWTRYCMTAMAATRKAIGHARWRRRIRQIQWQWETVERWCDVRWYVIPGHGQRSKEEFREWAATLS